MNTGFEQEKTENTEMKPRKTKHFLTTDFTDITDMNCKGTDETKARENFDRRTRSGIVACAGWGEGLEREGTAVNVNLM